MPCNYTKLRLKPKYFDSELLFTSKVHDLAARKSMAMPLKEITDALISDYSHKGNFLIKAWYIEQKCPTEGTSSTLSEELFNQW